MTDPSDDARISELLHSAAPDRPDLPPAARTTAVRDRAVAVRRRHRLVLAAAVLAVVGVGVGVPVLTSGDDPDRTSPVAEDPARADSAPVECPTTPTDVRDGVAAADLPAGATSARLCPASMGGQPEAPGFTLPTEPLTEGVDELVTRLVDLPSRPLDDMCAFTSAATMPWSLVIGYPDGTTRELGSSVTICATVDVAGEDVPVEDVLGAVQTALTSQRGPGAATCPTPGTRSDTIAADPDTFDGRLAELEVTSAAVCYGVDPMGSRAYVDTEGVLEGVALDRVLSDLLRNATAEPQVAGRCIDTGPTRLVVLVGAEGRVTLTDQSCTREFAYEGGFWLADQQSEDALADALGGPVGDASDD